jgi:ribosomal-protein-alanine N-acetyltransferase
VVEKLGFRYEGLRQRYLHIDGDWRDHVSYALTVDEVPGRLVDRFLAAQANTPRQIPDQPGNRP